MDDLGRLGRIWPEANALHTDLETVIQDLLEGQYHNPIGIFCFNTAERWSREVSAEVAAELRRRCDVLAQDVPSNIQDFVDRHDPIERSQLSLPLRRALP
jgi:hypothetical protein